MAQRIVGSGTGGASELLKREVSADALRRPQLALMLNTAFVLVLLAACSAVLLKVSFGRLRRACCIYPRSGRCAECVLSQKHRHAEGGEFHRVDQARVVEFLRTACTAVNVTKRDRGRAQTWRVISMPS